MNRQFWLKVVAVLSILVSVMVYGRLDYTLLTGKDLAYAFPDMINHINHNNSFFWLHILLSPVALAVGAFQFMPKIRNNNKRLHRRLGNIYVFSVLIGGVSGAMMSLTAEGGLSAQLGFVMLSIIWVATTVRAFHLALQKNFIAHQDWMIRSFALTLAGLTFRLQLPFFIAAGFTYHEATMYVAWTAWIPNLIIAEYLIRKKG